MLETRHVPWRIAVPLQGRPGHPGVPSGGATQGRLGKQRLVPVALEDVAEAMVVPLAGHGAANGHDVAVGEKGPPHESSVEPQGIEGFDSRLGAVG